MTTLSAMTRVEPRTSSPVTGHHPVGDVPTSLPWHRAVVLHTAPGVALLVFFLLTAPWLREAGLPPVWGLLLGTLLVVAPLELGLVWRAARRRRASGCLATLGLAPVRRADLRALLLAAAACLLGPGLVAWLEPVLRGSVFSWLPAWFSAGPTGLAGYSPDVRAWTVVLWLVSVVLVGPAVEEVYFRGWLLQRLPGGRTTRCTTHAALFAVYHVWQPYTWLTLFLFALPLTALVQARRNPALSIVVHCSVNLLVFAALFTGGLQR